MALKKSWGFVFKTSFTCETQNLNIVLTGSRICTLQHLQITFTKILFINPVYSGESEAQYRLSAQFLSGRASTCLLLEKSLTYTQCLKRSYTHIRVWRVYTSSYIEYHRCFMRVIRCVMCLFILIRCLKFSGSNIEDLMYSYTYIQLLR